MSEPRTMINGVPAEQYGLWCEHGKHLLVADPADTSDYPGCVPADPWPCPAAECTLAEVERQIREAETLDYLPSRIW